MAPNDRPALGLRERKKARTRAVIQQHALRLFREQGYEATTVEQIAEAAEVSSSTFFRYFPTKEEVALYDALDPLVIAAFEAQPPELSPMAAMRRAVREAAAGLSPQDLQEMQDRFDLIRAVPELRARMLDEFVRTIRLMGEVLAARLGKPPDDFAVRTVVGAFVGVGIAAMLAGEDDPSANLFALLDDGMALLEAGLPL